MSWVPNIYATPAKKFKNVDFTADNRTLDSSPLDYIIDDWTATVSQSPIS